MVTLAMAPELMEDALSYFHRDQVENDYGIYTLEHATINSVASAITWPHSDRVEAMQLLCQIGSHPEVVFSTEDTTLTFEGKFHIRTKAGEEIFELRAPLEVKLKTPWVDEQGLKFSVDALDVEKIVVESQHEDITAVRTAYLETVVEFILDFLENGALIKNELNKILEKGIDISQITKEFTLSNLEVSTGKDVATASADIVLNMNAIFK